MDDLPKQRWSKFVIIIFVLTLLTILYVLYALIFNWIQPTTLDGGIRIMKPALFNGLISAIIFFLLLILNISGLLLCTQKKTKGKILSIIGIVLSVALNLYILYVLLQVKF